MKNSIIPLIMILVSLSCAQNNSEQSDLAFTSQLENLNSIDGRYAFLDRPYVTAGDRLYMVGHQNGTFPDLGWHVKGEMGGIWDHPIKLMDGFVLSVKDINENTSVCLKEADNFRTYPVGNLMEYNLSDMNLDIQRFEFVPDGMEGIVLEIVIHNSSNQSKNLEFNFSALVDLRPVWLGEETGMLDHEDNLEYDEQLGAIVAKDKGNNWFCVIGSSQKPERFDLGKGACSVERLGKGSDGTIVQKIEVAAEEETHIKYYLAGSSNSREEAVETYYDLKQHSQEHFAKKISRYDKIKRRSDIDISDAELQQMFEWIKYGTDWLVRNVPDHGVGISAGIPDYPWWFGADLAYTVLGLLPIGHHQLAKDAINQIWDFSESHNGNGRIVHEVSTNGVVFNPGNVNETPIMISTSWDVFLWTGDLQFLKRAFEMAKKGLNWLESVDKDQNGYPDGHGMMEIHGLDSEMIDVVAYTQQAYYSASKMAEQLGDMNSRDLYAAKATELATKINEDWWVNSSGSFADFRAEKSKSMKLLDDAILRADTLDKPWAVSDLKAQKKQLFSLNDDKRGYTFYNNWVVNTPMEVGIADRDKAMLALETAKKFTNKFGLYVTGIDRDENFDESFAASKKKEEFNYVGAVMTLPTGVQAVSESRYGRPDEALQYLKMLYNSFSYATPGTLYEVSPDYGMLVQAWNIYSVARPIIVHFFGITPDAHNERIKVNPAFPSSWDDAGISRVIIGDNEFNMKMSKDEGETQFLLSQQNPDWTIAFQYPGKGTETIKVNGIANESSFEDGWHRVEINGNEARIEILN